MKNRWLKDQYRKFKSETFVPVNLNQILLILIIYAIGLLLSIVILFIEKIIFVLDKKNILKSFRF